MKQAIMTLHISSHPRPVKLFLEYVNGLVKTKMTSQGTTMSLSDQQLSPRLPGNAKLVFLEQIPLLDRIESSLKLPL